MQTESSISMDKSVIWERKIYYVNFFVTPGLLDAYDRYKILCVNIIKKQF